MEDKTAMYIKQYSESCEQNKEPILEVLQEVFKDRKTVLEIGSGSGQHAVYFAKHLKHLNWQPSDRAKNLSSIQAWAEEAALSNLKVPVELDVLNQPWNVSSVDSLFTANSLHIMSWEMVEQFFKGVGEILEPTGKLLVYGPFSYAGVHTSPSNARFDQYLRQQNPLSGVRDFDNLDDLAKKQGLTTIKDYDMPANNRCLLWAKA
jgi:cyclopropane fatty-acyl-phospholipid synthase-like methyltransferase